MEDQERIERGKCPAQPLAMGQPVCECQGSDCRDTVDRQRDCENVLVADEIEDPLQHHEHDQHPKAEPCQHPLRSEEHTSELQSLMRISYAVFCLKKKQEH